MIYQREDGARRALGHAWIFMRFEIYLLYVEENSDFGGDFRWGLDLRARVYAGLL